jgi:hypothetical protein
MPKKKRFLKFCFKRNELSNLREIFEKMLLFGKLNPNPIKELIESILADNRVLDFNKASSTLNEQVNISVNELTKRYKNTRI